MRIATRWLLAALLAGRASSAPAGEGVSFRRDVMQVLSKAGCNAGPCHGNANGKGGFKLSLRGEDAAADHAALVEELAGRRVSPADPDGSLVLLKATTALAHEGGRRFATNGWEYATLRRWIAAGARDDGTALPKPSRLVVSPTETFAVEPRDTVAIRATAVFADGTRRDVTREAVYEASNPRVKVTAEGRVERADFGETVVLARYLGVQAPVRVAFVPARRGFRWAATRPANYVDEHVFAKLRRMRLNPAPRCADEVFLRRAYLDLLGALPTAEEARAFVADRAGDKRARLVDALLGRPEYADRMALRWADLLRVEQRTLDRRGMTVFHRWLRDAFAENRPLDAMVRDIVSARGSTYANPPANFYRAARTPVERAVAVGQVFLGARLTCAQCHNHPFDRWSQDDYHDWAAVFARVNYKVLRNDRGDENDSHEFKGEQVVYLSAAGEVKNPRTGRPAVPRMLGIAGPASAAADVPDTQAAGAVPRPDAADTDGLRALAAWITSPTNAAFVRVQANRVWAQLMGRGLVDPVDDFRATNPATHPALLEALAADFVEHRFDVRHLVRVIMASRTYQADTAPDTTSADDDGSYARATVRRLGAEELLDAQHRVAGVPFRAEGWPAGYTAVSLPGGAQIREGRKTEADRFLEAFGKPPRALTCECERADAITLSQTLHLVSGPVMNRLLSAPDNRLGSMAASGLPPGELVDELYWTALTRAPSDTERAGACALLARGDRRAGLEDLAWSLMNSKEFVLRR